eukprot:CAMPEP_0170434816 /NCGR_PEP_ID=MMETSP0117_2-20130122/43255_1 /TAXON_ID=400756 /ORGANISM="Durinskia baltica, Strain CSIRO CS-38" /LENGTH=63 /DNA_ID=CAMNT_0010694701 /DNA_START=72 /DNA_END=260 /DNA_ORIENTATION=+
MDKRQEFDVRFFFACGPLGVQPRDSSHSPATSLGALDANTHAHAEGLLLTRHTQLNAGCLNMS